MMVGDLKEVGEVKHYYTDLGVAVIDLKDDIKEGDKILIAGKTTDFGQNADSIEIEHKKVSEAHAGDLVGLKVLDHTRPHDKVYLVA